MPVTKLSGNVRQNPKDAFSTAAPKSFSILSISIICFAAAGQTGDKHTAWRLQAVLVSHLEICIFRSGITTAGKSTVSIKPFIEPFSRRFAVWESNPLQSV
jgi:hypothetical protein